MATTLLDMHGIAIIDKPAGISSAKSLYALKQEFGRGVKVGHAGTLDPFATGILIALCGDATRLSDLAMSLTKEYLATIRFGWRTDTLDPDGQVVEEADPGEERDLASVLPNFVGVIEQMPPAFSALKVDGRRAYDLARRGETPKLRARNVRVDKIEIESVAWPEATIRITCGAGTYIRALARDIGEALGLPASLAALRRTAIGPFRTEHRHSMEDLVRAAGLPQTSLELADAKRFVVGQQIVCPPDPVGRVAVFLGDRLLGLGEARKEQLRASAVLSQARVDLEQGPV